MVGGGLYKNVKMSLTAANIAVICAIALLVFCFVFAINTAEKTSADMSEEVQSTIELN